MRRTRIILTMLLVFVLAITMCTEVFAGSDSGSKDNTGKKQICINKSQKGTNYYDEDGDYTGMYLSATKFYYTGKAIKPRVWVYVDGYCLVEGQDYEVKYQNNVNIGKQNTSAASSTRYATRSNMLPTRTRRLMPPI